MSTPRYSIRFKASAAKSLRKLDGPARQQISQAIESLADDPRPHGAQKLQGGHGEFRIRVSTYRVVYEINDGELMILVLHLGHRREVYRNL